MSSAISGSLNLSRAQSQIPIDETGAASNIQNFSTYDAVELIGYVFVNIPGEETDDYRASVKLSIVKNGAGSYEVAASDIAGDDYSGSPIVSFSMSGSLLQATLDSALVAAESPSESYIRYALSAPAVGGQDNISIDASKIVSGTIDSGVLDSDVYKQDNVLGTVSQVAGVPTGAIIESGSNSNGTYIKYADGTMICNHTNSSAVVTNTSAGANYVSPLINWTYPASFISNPVVIVSSKYASGSGSWGFTGEISTTAMTGGRLVSYGNTSTTYPTFLAIGRWY